MRRRTKHGTGPRPEDVTAIIPTVRCRNLRAALAFYTGVLDFERVDGDATPNDPSVSALARAEDYHFLSGHRGYADPRPTRRWADLMATLAFFTAIAVMAGGLLLVALATNRLAP